MYKDKKILAIIPARGGSKGLLKKNIRSLCGKPLIAWSIEQSKDSKYIDEIFVSTDSLEIADIAEKFGVKVPELRPDELAQDTSTSMDVILYTIDLMEKQGKTFDIIAMVEATSPLRESSDLDFAIEKLINTENAESIVGVSKTEGAHPDFLAYKKESDFIKPFGKDEFVFKRRQEIEDLYFFEGSLYISYLTSLKERKSFYHNKTLGYEMPKYKSFEVDDIVDFKVIEALMTAKQKNEI